MKIKHLGIIGIVSLLISSFMSPNEDNKTIYEFNKDANIGSWNIMNDDVMGGVSTSTFKLNSEGHGVFEGKVSTAYNGGFASVRYRSSENVGKSKSIKIRLNGDGKDYQFRIKKNSNDLESYITSFSTSGSWQTVEINLKDLYPSFRGRKLSQPNFDGVKFEEISFLIANKKDESFKLVLDRIEWE
jgi:hypothetical protein